jgi:putative cardiolipin synthase
MLRHALLGAVAALAALVAGCASPGPPPPVAEPRAALAPRGDSAFAPTAQALKAEHGAHTSGFLLLPEPGEALDWRLAAIDAARHSLDLQYYVWFGDGVGQLLMSHVIAAADRGVKVRILFDDLNTLLHDMTHVELRDAALTRIARHPNIEIRVFNAWRERGLLGRAAESLWDFERLNRRMHNKQMVADNHVAILGGRNIGDEYFGMHREFNFEDLDVLGIGPVARQASAVFDRYWNSAWVRPIPVTAAATPDITHPDRLLPLAAPLHTQRSAGQGAARLTRLGALLLPGTSRVHADSPSRAPGARNRMPEAFRALLRAAAREVLIVNAYVIPDEALIDDLRALHQRGVTVRLLTNSLASHDVPAVNSHYEVWRERLLHAGVALHELRADIAPQGSVLGLHTKAMVIDRQLSFIGSMNLDPRSELLNAEMGIAIDSAPLAQALAARIERDLGAQRSWRVAQDAQGHLSWTSDAGTLSRQPARSLWQRIENLLFKLLPADLY